MRASRAAGAPFGPGYAVLLKRGLVAVEEVRQRQEGREACND